MSGEKKDTFYMTLTPAFKVSTKEAYETMMSDFETQLRIPIKLDTRKIWKITMTNVFIPSDTRLISKSRYEKHWFQYIWCKCDPPHNSYFKEKYYFFNSNEREDVIEFCD